jgi:hypothetical protein
VLSSEVQPPKPESIKSFDIGDIAIMNQLAYSFKKEFIKYAKLILSLLLILLKMRIPILI